jgi:flagellar hook-basal body complex protein FliE
MTTPISAIGAISAPGMVKPAFEAGKPGEFQKVLESTIQTLQSTQNDASKAVQSFLTGESEDLHTTALATQRAEIAFELGLQVRNKVVSAYQEIMRMQM